MFLNSIVFVYPPAKKMRMFEIRAGIGLGVGVGVARSESLTTTPMRGHFHTPKGIIIPPHDKMCMRAHTHTKKKTTLH